MAKYRIFVNSLNEVVVFARPTINNRQRIYQVAVSQDDKTDAELRQEVRTQVKIMTDEIDVARNGANIQGTV